MKMFKNVLSDIDFVKIDWEREEEHYSIKLC